MTQTEVLVVGAGPTGLFLALWLARLGVAVTIIDETAEPATTSRALGMQARTLEFYRQLGLAEAVLQRGVEVPAANLWVRGRQIARLPFGAIGEGLSPYAFLFILPQDDHERFLVDCLATEGVAVERRTELVGFDDDGERVVARLKGPDGAERSVAAAYLAGCDGAHSRVREVLGIGFPGGIYDHLFYVADTESHGPVTNHELHVALDDSDFLAAFPMKGEGRVRLVGMAEAPGGDEPALVWADVDKTVLSRLGIAIERVNWFSTYRVHHRVADRFRVGRAFLLGDAGHIHSPAGGQGMNTGMGDAVNLAWKLAAALQGRAAERLLDTYESERIAFARRLVETTDRGFTIATSPGRLARFVRVRLFPRLMPVLITVGAVRRFLFRTLSQIVIRYPDSALSEGRAGEVRGGDRLPWVPSASPPRAGDDNFVPLTSLDWQVHVYGEPSEGLAEVCRRRGLRLEAFPWIAAAQRAGLARNATYVIRPDGYVGLADAGGSGAALERYLDSRGIEPLKRGHRAVAPDAPVPGRQTVEKSP